MKKLFYILAFAALLFLTGCQENEPMPHREIPNKLSSQRVLILTHQSEYVLQVLTYLEKRAGQVYSVTIDDLSQILEYNFAYYNGVLIIEKLNSAGSAPVLDKYMQEYSGVNNIVLHGLDNNYTSPYPLSVVTANTQDLSAETLRGTAERIYYLLRNK